MHFLEVEESVMPELISVTKQSDAAKYLIQKDEVLSSIINRIDILTYELYDDPYLFLIKTIISQTLSHKSAVCIFKKLESLCNNTITPHSIGNLKRQDLIAIGISTSKTDYILTFTTEIISGRLNLNRLNKEDDKKIIQTLTNIQGIGTWTVKIYLLFFLNRPNVLPIEDKTFLRAYQKFYNAPNLTSTLIEANCQKWQPYMSIAVRYLYYALNTDIPK